MSTRGRLDTGELFDEGLQPERTMLAWRRTCLSFAVGSLIAARFTVELVGVFAILLGVLGAGLSVAAYFLTASGYRRVAAALVRGEDALPYSGWPMLLATVATLALGTACAIFLLFGVL